MVATAMFVCLWLLNSTLFKVVHEPIDGVSCRRRSWTKKSIYKCWNLDLAHVKTGTLTLTLQSKSWVWI